MWNPNMLILVYKFHVFLCCSFLTEDKYRPEEIKFSNLGDQVYLLTKVKF
jgi:hypothetical protein